MFSSIGEYVSQHCKVGQPLSIKKEPTVLLGDISLVLNQNATVAPTKPKEDGFSKLVTVNPLQQGLLAMYLIWAALAERDVGI